MDFDLNEEQKMIRESLIACFSKLNQDDVLVRKYDSDPGLDEEAWQAQLELGLVGTLVPEDQGGLGLDLLTVSVVSEIAGAYAVATPLEYQCLAAWALACSSASSATEAKLQAVISGTQLAGLALYSNPDDETLTFTSRGVSGSAPYVPFAEQVDIAVIALDQHRVGLIELQQPGVSLEPVAALDRSRPLAHLHLDQAQVDPLPGVDARRLYEAALIVHAAGAFGAAKRCLDMAVDYAKMREQFGRAIGSFQSLKHQLAHMALELEPARYLWWYTAHCWDTAADDASQMASICKAHLGEVAVRTCRAAVEAHGGIGFTWEYPLHIWLKRAMADSAIYGTPARQRARSAALANW